MAWRDRRFCTATVHTHAVAGPVGVGGFSAAVITALAARPPPPPPPQSYDLSFDSWRDKFP